MLDMGFQEDLEGILSETPADRQTMLFSATMPKRIDKLARQHLQDPVRITLSRDEAVPGGSPLIRQVAFVVARPTSRRRSAGCSTSRHPKPRSCSAAPGTRSTSSPRP
jgi:superfamily II DNA/RNA helicase